MGEVITAEGKAILNHDLEMGITGIYVHVDLLPRMREWLDRLSAHYDSLIAAPATIRGDPPPVQRVGDFALYGRRLGRLAFGVHHRQPSANPLANAPKTRSISSSVED
jgi:hypothetical protein